MAVINIEQKRTDRDFRGIMDGLYASASPLHTAVGGMEAFVAVVNRLKEVALSADSRLDDAQRNDLLHQLGYAYHGLRMRLNGGITLDHLGIGIRGPAGLILIWAGDQTALAMQDEIEAFQANLCDLIRCFIRLQSVLESRGADVATVYRYIDDALLGRAAPPLAANMQAPLP